MIALNPDHFDATLRIRQFADVGKEAPVLFLQPGEIQVAEDVTQQHQALKMVALQHAQGVARAAGFRPEVQIGEDERIAVSLLHLHYFCSSSMLGGDERTVNNW